MSLEHYLTEFRSLNVNRQGGHASPHKVCMLLAAMDLIESEAIVDNKIFFNQKLLDSYSEHFASLQRSNDTPNPHLPFYHLKSAQFWHHEVKTGMSSEYEKLSKSVSVTRINKSIDFAFFDNELFELLKYSTTRELFKYELFENIDESQRDELREGKGGWSSLECELIVADYINMLLMELNRQSFVKSKHREQLRQYLHNRSNGSVEYKYQNISAILIELGLPYIRGYKPAFNYQKLLFETVRSQVAGRIKQVTQSTEVVASDAPEKHIDTDWHSVMDEAPIIDQEYKKTTIREYQPRIYDYAGREERNRNLGQRGEEFVLEFERNRLTSLGRKDLAKKIEWTSKERGDGAGYDISSFQNQEGSDLYIEVKTTNQGKYLPFYISNNEVAFSEENPENYSLYRVYDFRTKPRIFTLNGSVRENAILRTKQYQASFR